VPDRGHGKAVTALVLGICTIFFSWTTFLDGILVVIALIFGVLAFSESGRGSSGRSSMRRLAVAGLICTAVGAVAAVLWTVFFLHAVNQCGGIGNDRAPGFEQCVSNQI
jgi:lysylphosphatidylglycerol synthetase-like protein (DUF2156 family)